MAIKHTSRNYNKHCGTGDDRHTFPPNGITANSFNSIKQIREDSTLKCVLDPTMSDAQLLASIVSNYTVLEDVQKCYSYEKYKKLYNGQLRELRKKYSESPIEILRKKADDLSIGKMSKDVIASKYDVANFQFFSEEQLNAVVNAVIPLITNAIKFMEKEHKLSKVKKVTETAKSKNAPVK